MLLGVTNFIFISLFSLFIISVGFNPVLPQEDGDVFSIFPDDYYNPEDYGEEPTKQFDSDKATGSSDLEADSNQSDLNFVAAGDFNCNEDSEKTIRGMTELNPELVLGLGDYTYESISPKCWFDMSEPIDDIIKITTGNHDLDFLSSYYQLLDHYGITKPYYSFDFGKTPNRIHFIALSTEHPFEEGSEQFEFVKQDLEQTSQNQNIMWRIVFLHKPLYTSTDFDENNSQDLRETYHKLFEDYGVDLVLSGHTHFYQRSLPLSYNNDDAFYPIVSNENGYEYDNNDGIIFITSGTGGDEPHNIDFARPYYVIEKVVHGFINFDIKNGGKTLMGTFYENNNLEVVDQFTINKDTKEKPI